MRFALMLGPVYPPRDLLPSERAFAYHRRFLETAEAVGFDGVSVNHHYLVGPEAQCFQPLVTAAYVLARFPRLHVLTSVLLIPYHNPVEIAEQVATIEMIAPGRLLLGVGQGYREAEAAALGITHTSRRDRMAEGITALRSLWHEGDASFQGEYYRFEHADIGVKPSDRSGPPILVAADKLKTVARVPRIGGDHWLPSPRHTKAFLREALDVYRAALEKEGRPFRGIPLQRDICVARSEREAEDLMRTSYEAMLTMQHRWGQPGERYDLPFDELKKDRVILGDPAQVAEEIVDLHNEFHAEFLSFRAYTPGMDPERALDVVRLIGEDVLPLVRSEVGTGSLFP